MLKRKVIATDITNLTDARYFAARGVDFLLFDLDAMSIISIQEIADWIEGPMVLLYFSEKSIGLLDEAVLKISPYGIGTSDQKVRNDLDFMSAHVTLFFRHNNSIELGVDVFRTIGTLAGLQSIPNDEGIILSGSSEELVGLKNFDEMDEILDLLED